MIDTKMEEQQEQVGGEFERTPVPLSKLKSWKRRHILFYRPGWCAVFPIGDLQI